MKLQLNLNKPDNYAFFCPVSRVHLTRSNPVVYVNEVTPYINRGLKTKAIIDITETEQKVEKAEQPQQKEEEVQVQQEESTSLVQEEHTVEAKNTEAIPAEPSEKPKKGRQRKS
jgi:hypothetical protein